MIQECQKQHKVVLLLHVVQTEKRHVIQEINKQCRAHQVRWVFVFKVIVSMWISTIYFSKTQKWYQHKKKLKRMLLFEQLWYSFTSQTKQWSLFAQFLFYRPVVPVMKMFWWQFANCANRSFLIWQGGWAIL